MSDFTFLETQRLKMLAEGPGCGGIAFSFIVAIVLTLLAMVSFSLGAQAVEDSCLTAGIAINKPSKWQFWHGCVIDNGYGWQPAEEVLRSRVPISQEQIPR